jgi:hypothetical protein
VTKRRQQKRPRALVKSLRDSDRQSDFVKALRAAGILPRQPVRGDERDDNLRNDPTRSRPLGRY